MEMVPCRRDCSALSVRVLSGIPDTGINTGIRAQWRYTGICDHYRYHTGILVYRYRPVGKRVLVMQNVRGSNRCTILPRL